MRKSFFPLLLITAGLTAAAHAQLTYTGFSQSTQGTGATAVGSYSGSVVAVVAAGEGGFVADDLYSYRVNHGATSASASLTHYFSLQTDNLPVRLDLLTGLFDGKLVYGGGGLSTNYTVDLSGRVSIYEYDDANNNDIFDPTELSYLAATSGAISLASLSTNGTALYDTAGTPMPGYVLGANTNYMLALESSWALSGTAAPTDASVVITVEHVTPLFSGHSATFEYQTVPEPTTAALFGASVLVFGRRRR